jgi:hypothetical protein
MPKLQYQKLVDTDGVDVYVGEALPGTARSSPAWRIKKVIEGSNMIKVIWGDSTSDFDKVWDNRSGYDYVSTNAIVYGTYLIGPYNTGVYN